jgi:Zn-dependent M28 family amino/carboxypeptidase
MKPVNFCTLIIVTLLLAGSGCSRQDSNDPSKLLNERSLRARTKFLSDDLLGGRAPGSTGSLIAQRYIASEMQQIGLSPGSGDTSYYQSFEMLETNIDKKIALDFNTGNKRITPQYFDDFIVFPGNQERSVAVDDAELVFAGYGIKAPEFNWDDFKDVDVKGKVLLLMNNDPDNGDPEFFGGKARLYYGRWDYKYEQAAKMGAIGAIIIHTDQSAGYPWQVVQTSWSGSLFELPSEEKTSMEFKAWVTEKLAYTITELSGNNLDELRKKAQQQDFKPVMLGINVHCSFGVNHKPVKVSNVIGLLPGGDPDLSNQAIVISAHYDHLGTGKPVQGDSIYNGALDNASGVASILELADAFAKMKSSLRRSLVFLAVDGEESGLLGSLYYSEHPTFPPENIAADINIDGANIWGKTKDVVLIGYGKSTIDEIVKKYAGTQDRYVVPDLTPEQGSFYRSDQLNFAKKGIPALYMGTGQDFINKPEGWGKEIKEEWIRKKYHQPGDEYDPAWNLAGQMEDLVLIFNVIEDIADDDNMPAWLPGAEFESIRKNKVTDEK